MSKLYYCTECRGIVKPMTNEGCCSGDNLKEIKLGTSVNVIGSKIKGSVYKIKDDMVTLVIRDESGNKFLKEFEYKNLRKII